MSQRIKSFAKLSTIFCIAVIAVVACTQISSPTAIIPEATVTELISDNEITPTSTPSSEITWPVYTLETKLPDSPPQLRLYKQVVPGGQLPDEERVKRIMEQLQITGIVTYHTGNGNHDVSVVGNSGSFSLEADDPFLLRIQNVSQTQTSSTPVTTIVPPDVRIQTAKVFLNDRRLLDFPYLIEPPKMSRDRDRAVRVVPLIDGYRLYDYNALNGRLLVLFNSTSEISQIFWRPLKIIPLDTVDIVPAAVAWDQLVKGETPTKGPIGQCWQAAVFDSANGVEDHIDPINSECTRGGGGWGGPYTAATINEVDLVYFADDLSLGMAGFGSYPDIYSPYLPVFPMWQFSGVTADGRELIVIWPAIAAP